MNREDIIRMAREAGFDHIAEADYWHPLFERFAAFVASAEREACAKLCEEMRTYVDRNNAVTQASANECANAIRARGQA